MNTWGLSLINLINLTKEANVNIIAVTNRLHKIGTEEMIDLAKFLKYSKNRRFILKGI